MGSVWAWRGSGPGLNHATPIRSPSQPRNPTFSGLASGPPVSAYRVRPGTRRRGPKTTRRFHTDQTARTRTTHHGRRGGTECDAGSRRGRHGWCGESGRGDGPPGMPREGSEPHQTSGTVSIKFRSSSRAETQALYATAPIRESSSVCLLYRCSRCR